MRMLRIYNWLIAPIPGARIIKLRIWWLRKCGVAIGQNVRIDDNVRFVLRNAHVSIGSNVKIGSDTVFRIVGASMRIGNRVEIQNDIRFYAEGEGGCVSLSDGVIVRKGVNFEFNGGGRIDIGENSEVNHGTLLAANCGAHISIGRNVRVAHFISIKCSTHEIEPNSDVCIAGKSITKDIAIGDGSWIGGSATLLPGVRLGRYNIVAGGAVVTKSTPDRVMVAGVPADVKKRYYEN